jgi:hypothetical protein
MLNIQELAISAAHYLFEGNELEELELLCSCDLEFREASSITTDAGWNTTLGDRVVLAGSRDVYAVLRDGSDERTRRICKAFNVAARSLDERLSGIELLATFRPLAKRAKPTWLIELTKELPALGSVDAEFSE